MRAVNLLPAEGNAGARSSTFSGLRKHALPLLAVVVALGLAGGVLLQFRSASSTVSARQQSLRDLEAQLAKLPQPETSSSAQTAAQRLGVVKTVASGRTTWDGFLYAVSRVIPEDVWLLNMSASATPQAAAATPAPSTPGAFTVTGYTYSQPSVARLMRRLRMVPWLDGVSLTTSSKTTLADHVVYQFTLGANVISLPEVRS